MRIPLSGNDPDGDHLQTRRFRKLLEAFGYPARIFDMAEPARIALLACLCDEDTPLALEGSAAPLAGAQSARLVPVVGRAAAAFVLADARGFDWRDLPAGSAEAPETSATLVLEVADLAARKGPSRITARGAGVRDEAAFHLDQDSATALAHRPDWPYPSGVDIILTSGAKILALPRHLSWRIG